MVLLFRFRIRLLCLIRLGLFRLGGCFWGRGGGLLGVGLGRSRDLWFLGFRAKVRVVLSVYMVNRKLWKCRYFKILFLLSINLDKICTTT